jgi:hypothetical protein
MSAGSVIRTPVNLDATAQPVFLKGFVDYDLASRDHGDPSVGVRDMQFVIGLFQNSGDALRFGYSVETRLGIYARGRDDPNLYVLVLMLFHF